MGAAAPESGQAKGFNLFRWIATLGIRHPWLVLGLVGVVAAIAGRIAWDVPVSTSRYKLVSEKDNPLQAELERFFARFGYQDALVMVVSGSTAAEQQRVVGELCTKLEAEPEFAGRILCRIGAEQMAELAFLFKPDALGEIARRLGKDRPIAELVEGGLPAWIAATERQIAAGLEGTNGDSAPSAAEADQGLHELARLLYALDAQLRGADPMSVLPAFDAADAGHVPGGVTLDEQGFLVGADRSFHLVALFPELPGTEGLELKPFVDKARAVRNGIALGEVHADLTGMPAVVVDELHIVERGLEQSTLATTIGILVLLLIGFRSFRYSIFALVPLGVGTVCSVAFARLAFGGTNLITSAFVSVLMGIGSDFAIIMLGRYSERLRAGDHREAAIRNALALCGPGTVIAAATTIIAFLTLTTTTFTAFAQMGIIVGVGLALMVLFTLVLLPPLAQLFNRRRRKAAAEFIGMHFLPPAVRRGRLAILVVGSVLAVGAAINAFGIEFNARYFDFLPAHAESVRGLALVETDKSVSPLVANVPADDVESARALAAALRKLETVGAVDTATDALPELTTARLAELRAGLVALGRKPDFARLRGRARSGPEVAGRLRALADTFDEVAFALREAGRPTRGVDEAKAACAAVGKTLASLPDGGGAALGRLELAVANLLDRGWSTAAAVAERGFYLPTDLPPVFRAHFMAKDGQGLALFAMPAGNVWAGDAARRFHDEVLSVAPQASGLALEIHAHQHDILSSFTRAALLTAGLMFFVCLVSLRSFWDSLLAMLPVLVGFSLMMGFMVAADMRLNVANIVALPQLLGISVELGSQIVVRTRQSAAERGGVGDLKDILQGTGSSILIAAGTTIVGFAALTIADYRAMKSLGVIMTVGTTSTIVASLLFLPAVLLLLKRAR
ncbi:MAG: MMPL family transporter [Polyangiaceae bacterium]|nr:MMPL family transporter [Polyangiaceae bacterium]